MYSPHTHTLSPKVAPSVTENPKGQAKCSSELQDWAQVSAPILSESLLQARSHVAKNEVCRVKAVSNS